MAKTLFHRKKTPGPSGFVPALSLICIVMGSALFLCFDTAEEPVAPAFVSGAPQEVEPAEAPTEAIEEAEAAAGPPEPAPLSVPAAAKTPREAPETPAETVAEAIDTPFAGDETFAGGGQIPAVTAASSADEKTPTAAREEIPPPGAVDVAEIDDYFSDALFIGASRTQGLLLYSNLGNASYYAAKGLTVDQVFKKPVVESEDGKLTVSDALGRRAFGKVYLMFGLNELGWNSADKFIETYGLVLDRVKETQPDAVIYVQSVMPVSAWKSERDAVHNNPNIERCNERLMRLAEEKNAIYLNIGESVANENGVLPNEASSDGIHLNRKYCVKWEQYLRAHEI
jgi:lysophospholipase L1-like esterase